MFKPEQPIKFYDKALTKESDGPTNENQSNSWFGFEQKIWFSKNLTGRIILHRFLYLWFEKRFHGYLWPVRGDWPLNRTTNSSLFNQRKSHLWKKCWICFELTFLAELIGWISIRYRKNEQLSCSQVRNFRLSLWLRSHNKDNYIFISNRALHFKYLESVEPTEASFLIIDLIICTQRSLRGFDLFSGGYFLMCIN